MRSLADSRRLVWWPRGRPQSGSMAVRWRWLFAPLTWLFVLIRPPDGFGFQKRQVTMQERRLEQEIIVPSDNLWASKEDKFVSVFPTKDVGRVRQNNSVLAPSSGQLQKWLLYINGSPLGGGEQISCQASSLAEQREGKQSSYSECSTHNNMSTLDRETERRSA